MDLPIPFYETEMLVVNLKNFFPTKSYLVCIDSDGCVMDTMDIKHHQCFGPCLVKTWGLEHWERAILSRWNQQNLYTMTRGVNRFKGLAMALKEIHAEYCRIADLTTLLQWVDTAHELSNPALAQAIEQNPGSVALQKALEWSNAVNHAITHLPQEKLRPFPLTKEALQLAQTQANVVVVSSANRAAVEEEWGKHGLLPYVDLLLTQDDGSKAYCIGELRSKGYSPDRILMCGDAPGDLQAAQKNKVLFYPILVQQERDSWQEFLECAYNKFLDGTYSGSYETRKIRNFLNQLGGDTVE